MGGFDGAIPTRVYRYAHTKMELARMHANDSLKVKSTQCSIGVYYLEAVGYLETSSSRP